MTIAENLELSKAEDARFMEAFTQYRQLKNSIRKLSPNADWRGYTQARCELAKLSIEFGFVLYPEPTLNLNL